MKKNKTWLFAILLLIGGIALAFLWNKFIPQPAIISGKINIVNKNGITKNGTIYLLYHDPIDNSFKETGVIADAKDGVTWTWERAVTGKKYQLRAQFRFDNQATESATVTVVAPANNVDLILE